MVQPTSTAHGYSPGSTKALEAVPPLGWGRGRECTFAGALEAALAVTDFPFKYSDLMGFSALAFRVRWWRWTGHPDWCHSCAIGEFPEECKAIERATGWRLRKEMQLLTEPNMDQFLPDIIASINAGRPVLAYEPKLNMDVIYGYEDGGRTLLMRDYFLGDAPLRLQPSRLGGMAMFLTDRAEPMPRRQAVLEGLKTAVRNWWRRHGDGGVSGLDYWYGDVAYIQWIEDLNNADEFSADKRAKLRQVSAWNYATLVDARTAAAAYLRDAEDLFEGDSRDELILAAAACQQAVCFFDEANSAKDTFSSIRSEADWSLAVRHREQEIIFEARKNDAASIAHIEAALDAQNIEVQRR